MRTESETVGLLWARLHPLIPIVLIAGCAGSMGTMRPTPAATLVTDFDGSYRNTLLPAAECTQTLKLPSKRRSKSARPAQPILHDDTYWRQPCTSIQVS
jgi:hypothetical protein